jgi:putative flippase GtrA
MNSRSDFLISKKRVGTFEFARQGLGYLFVGGMAAVIDIGLFYLISERTTGVLLPAVISFLIAAAFNYTLSSLWIFQRQWLSWRRMSLFLMFAMIGLSINAGATWWLAGYLSISPTLAKIGGVGIAFAVNFLMNSLIVFRREDA